MIKIYQGRLYEISEHATNINLWKNFVHNSTAKKYPNEFYLYGKGGSLPPKTKSDQKLGKLLPGDKFLVRHVLFENETYQCLEVEMVELNETTSENIKNTESNLFLWSVYGGEEKIKPHLNNIDLKSSLEIEIGIEVLQLETGSVVQSVTMDEKSYDMTSNIAYDLFKLKFSKYKDHNDPELNKFICLLFGSTFTEEIRKKLFDLVNNGKDDFPNHTIVLVDNDDNRMRKHQAGYVNDKFQILIVRDLVRGALEDNELTWALFSTLLHEFGHHFNNVFSKKILEKELDSRLEEGIFIEEELLKEVVSSMFPLEIANVKLDDKEYSIDLEFDEKYMPDNEIRLLYPIEFFEEEPEIEYFHASAQQNNLIGFYDELSEKLVKYSPLLFISVPIGYLPSDIASESEFPPKTIGQKGVEYSLKEVRKLLIHYGLVLDAHGHESIEKRAFDQVNTAFKNKNLQFDKLEVKRIYFANWQRDLSQIITAHTYFPSLGIEFRSLFTRIVSFLAMDKFGAGYKVEEKYLGVYRPEEHIDNPKDITTEPVGKEVINSAIKFAENIDYGTYLVFRFFGVSSETAKNVPYRPAEEPYELKIHPEKMMKNFIISEDSSIPPERKTSLTYILENLNNAMQWGKVPKSDRMKRIRENENNPYLALGNALHTIEDYFAHSNFVELLIKQIGEDLNDNELVSVYTWIEYDDALGELVFDDNQKTTNPDKMDIIYQSQFNLCGNPEDIFLTENLYSDMLPVTTGKFDKWDTIVSLLHMLSSKLMEIKIWDPLSDELTLFQKLLNVIVISAIGDEHPEIANMFKNLLKTYNIVSSALKIFIDFSDAGLPKMGTKGIVRDLIISLIKHYVMVIFKFLLGLIIHELSMYFVMYKNRYTVWGTNPSHSQIAKDDFEHPLHDLAGRLATEAVRQIGISIANYWNNINDTDPRELVKDILVHPKDLSNNTLVFKEIAFEWIVKHRDKIREAHRAEIVINRYQKQYEKFEKMKPIYHQLETELQKFTAELKPLIECIVLPELEFFSEEALKFINTVGDIFDEVQKIANEIESRVIEAVNKLLEMLPDRIKDYIPHQRALNKSEQQIIAPLHITPPRQKYTLPEIDWVHLTIMFSQYEGDEIIPSFILEEYLSRDEMLSLGRVLRDRVLDNWKSKGKPLDFDRFVNLLDESEADLGTRLILCHNVAKAFARGSSLIRWERKPNTSDMYSDGVNDYKIKKIHEDGHIMYKSTEWKKSIYYLLFDRDIFRSKDMQVDPGDWYHFFIFASIAYLTCDYRVTRSRRERKNDDIPGNIEKDYNPFEDVGDFLSGIIWPFPYEIADNTSFLSLISRIYNEDLIDQVTYLNVVGRGINYLIKSLMDYLDITKETMENYPAIRAWMWATSLSFFEGSYYGEDQQDVNRESSAHLRGLSYGLNKIYPKKKESNERDPNPPIDSDLTWLIPKAGVLHAMIDIDSRKSELKNLIDKFSIDEIVSKSDTFKELLIEIFTSFPSWDDLIEQKIVLSPDEITTYWDRSNA